MYIGALQMTMMMMINHCH